MKFTDTKIGMKIKRIGEDHKDVKKGSVYTIEKAHCGGVSLKGMGDYWYDLDLFEPVVMELEQSKDEPVNKFEVGDEVIWKNWKVKIWGIRYDNEVKEYEYAIEDYKDNVGRTIVFECELSPLKKKDELEVGDKFVDLETETVEVLAKGKTENEIFYLGEREDGWVGAWSETEVQEIIYD